MNSGRLNRMIDIQKNVASTARSTDGGIINTLTTISSNVWAEREFLTANEQYADDQMFYTPNIRYSIRHTTVLDSEGMILDGSKYYDIISINNKNDKNDELIILVKAHE